MGQITTLEVPQQAGVIAGLASDYGMDRAAFVQTMKATIMPNGGGNVTNEQIAAFCLVAREHKLNPFTKEIFAFPGKGGGIQPVVSVDGWMKLVNSHPQFDGMEFKDALNDKGDLLSVTCRIYRKDRQHPVEVTEYMSECRRDTDVWRKWPARMLRHKAAIQTARYAFGFAGIMEPDEVERMVEIQSVEAEVVPAAVVVDERKARCDAAYEQYGPSIDLIKECIQRWDESQDPDELYTVKETWGCIPQAAQMDLWLAPSKGGVLTTHERDTIKNKLPKD